MSQRYFEFESMIGKDENDRIKIELATDLASEFRFSFNYDNPELVITGLSMINELSLLKTAQYTRSLVAYKDWYANELIRRITNDKQYFEKQSEAKKDVLRESIQRRNKLVKQIGKAMSYYDDNKDKIDQMQAIRANYQKVYPGAMLSVTTQHFILEILTEYQDIYCQFSLELQGQNIQEDTEQGYGWMEMSKVFQDTIQQIHSITTNSILISNSKPRSDIRVIRRRDDTASHILNLPDNYLSTFQLVTLSQVFVTNQVSKGIGLSKAQTFQIIDFVVNRISHNTQFTLKIIIGPAYSYQLQAKPHEISIFMTGEDQTYLAKMNSTVFYNLSKVCHLIESSEILFIGTNLGVLFNIKLQGASLTYIINADQSAEKQYLREVLYNYINHHPEAFEDYSTELIIKGDLGILPSGVTYQRVLSAEQSQPTSRQRSAYILLDVTLDSFVLDGDRVSFQQDQIECQIQVDKYKVITGWKCNCGGVHSKYKCEHLLACLLYGYKEGYFLA